MVDAMVDAMIDAMVGATVDACYHSLKGVSFFARGFSQWLGHSYALRNTKVQHRPGKIVGCLRFLPNSVGLEIISILV